MTTSPTPASDADKPSLLRRISIAFGALFRLIGDPDLAARYLVMKEQGVWPVPTPAAAPAPAAAAPVLKDASPDSALQLLALLQRDARLIDFISEDIGGYTDEQIGAAARLVHEGCAKVLREHFSIAPVRDEPEGARVTLPAGFDAASVRVTGNVVGGPPFTGSLNHRGWRVTDVRLPQLAERHDTRVIVPAEVEL
ncbi:MAG TPA: DUF2760 domain-containing protein [Burkholderiaceae bacterium]|nr:DUF2760 domain-containing protein [Burkholderiaceae bacterium]